MKKKSKAIPKAEIHHSLKLLSSTFLKEST